MCQNHPNHFPYVILFYLQNNGEIGLIIPYCKDMGGNPYTLLAGM